jgi:hypothetical protein
MSTPELILKVPVNCARYDIATLKTRMTARKVSYDPSGMVSSSCFPVSILNFLPKRAGEYQKDPSEKQTSVATRMGI